MIKLTVIAPKGRTLVAAVNAKVKNVHKVVGASLTEAEAEQLSDLLEKLYGFVEGVEAIKAAEAE